MDNAGYVNLSRQHGLFRELNIVANNLANMNTNGFRREGTIFAEHVAAFRNGDPSISMATQSRRTVDLSAGEATITGGALDLSIEGEGFFIIETPEGERLTRDGAFSLNAQGEMVNTAGMRLLDESGGAIVLPRNQENISVSNDGFIFADGQPVSKVGVVTTDAAFLVRDGQNLFIAENGYEPVTAPQVRQGVLESSNVNAIEEMARLIEVQRLYEASKQFADNENDRIERTIRTLGQSQ